MGLNHLPSINDYWSRDHYAPIADVISRQRFRDISQYLHFVDNDHLVPRGDPSYNRLGKIRPLIEHLGERFEALYNPTQNVAVDEAMIKFQGQSSLKQYNMPMKLIKRGIKVWVLADSANGYFHKFDIYTGKQKKRQVGLGEYVVKTCACNHLQRDVNGDGVRSAGRTPTRGLTDVTSVVSGSAMVETQHQTVSICGIRTCKYYNYYLIYCL